MSFQSLLSRPAAARDYARNEAYFNGLHRLDALGVNLPPEMRLLEMVVDWPRITVESLEERLNIEGFSMRGESDSDNHYQDRWQANRLDMVSTLVHTEALAQGISYVVVGPPSPGGQFAVVTPALAKSVRALTDPASGQVTEALQFYTGADGLRHAVHYQPGVNTDYAQAGGQWQAVQVMDSGCPVVPVVPFVNRARIGSPDGVSEMRDVMRYTDACSRALTNLQVATELVALPQRYVLGADPKSFVSQDGQPQTMWETYIGRYITGPASGHVGSLPGADLSQIANVVRLYAGFVSATTGIALTSLGISSEANPASAEALAAAENRHVKKAERKQVVFGEAWETVQRIADQVEGREQATSYRLETRWRDAATPTLSQKAAAVVQLVQTGVIPPAVARDLLDLTSEQKAISDAADEQLSKLTAAVGGTSEPQPVPAAAGHDQPAPAGPGHQPGQGGLAGQPPALRP